MLMVFFALSTAFVLSSADRGRIRLAVGQRYTHCPDIQHRPHRPHGRSCSVGRHERGNPRLLSRRRRLANDAVWPRSAMGRVDLLSRLLIDPSPARVRTAREKPCRRPSYSRKPTSGPGPQARRSRAGTGTRTIPRGRQPHRGLRPTTTPPEGEGLSTTFDSTALG